MKEALADRIMRNATGLYAGKRISIVACSVPRLSSPVVFSANHPTTLDPLLLHYALKQSCASLLTEVAFTLPGIGAVLRAGRHFPVGGRSAGGEALIGAAAERARAGRSISIFPEGCLSPGLPLAPLHSGAVRIAAEARVPIVPVGIAASETGVREVSFRFGEGLETGRYLLRGWYIVRAGKPLVFDTSPDDRQAVGECTAVLAKAMGRLASEASSLLAILEGREDVMKDDEEASILASS